MAEETKAAEAPGTEQPGAAATTETAPEAATPTLKERLSTLFGGRPVRSAQVRHDEAEAARTAAAAPPAPPAPPEDPDDEDDEPGEDATAAEDAAQQPGETTGRKRGKRPGVRIKELKAEIAKRDLELARMQGRQEAVRERDSGKGAEKPEAATSAQAAATAAEDAEPQEENFGTTREYQKALALWGGRQALREKEAKDAAEQKRLTAEEQRAKTLSNWEAQISKGRERWEDFEAVALSPKTYSAAMLEWVARSELGAELAYHLGRTLPEAARIARLEPLEAVAALAKIERDIESGRIPFPTDTAQDGATTLKPGEEPGSTAPAAGTRTEPGGDAAGSAAAGEPAQPAAPRRTRAAAPLTPIRGGERPEPDLAGMAKSNPAEFMRLRNKQTADPRPKQQS